MGDHEHACLRNGTQQPHHTSGCERRRLFGVCSSPCIHLQPREGGEWASALLKTEPLPEMQGAATRQPSQSGCANTMLAVMCQPPFTRGAALPLTRRIRGYWSRLLRARSLVRSNVYSHTLPPHLDSFSNQVRLPAELKHITKRRKRN